MMKSSILVTMHDSWSPIMHYINSFHDQVMVVLVMIMSLIGYTFISVGSGKEFGRSMKSSEWLEILWTIIPCGILATLAAPSLVTLYLSEEVKSPSMTVKVIGHQWYWSYEWSDFSSIEFDSFLQSLDNMESGSPRLLEVDERFPLPLGHEIRLVVTSTDVIHSWTVPALGVKVDAIPGRINQLSLLPHRVGVLYGQCSEICGTLHSFMPISVEVLTEDEFLKIMTLGG